MILYTNRQWWRESEHLPDKYIPQDQYRKFSEYPAIMRDISVISKDKEETLFALIACGGKYLEAIHLIDEYPKLNSLTFRVFFQSIERTLTNGEIDEDMKRIVAALESEGDTIR